MIDQLNQVVRSSEEFQNAEAAGRLTKIPTGDGMALIFYKSPAQPVECALEISRALKSRPELRVRMGSAVMQGEEANTKVKEFAQKALALDPELAEARMSLALAFVAAYDWRGGLKEFDRALELNPNLAFAYELQAWTVNGLGRFNEAIAKTRKALELDPLNPFFQMALSFFLHWARQYDDAIVQARKTLEMDPNSAISHVVRTFRSGNCGGETRA